MHFHVSWWEGKPYTFQGYCTAALPVPRVSFLGRKLRGQTISESPQGESPQQVWISGSFKQKQSSQIKFGLGPPAVPFLTLVWLGGFPYTKIDYRKKKTTGALILTSLLKDLADVLRGVHCPKLTGKNAPFERSNAEGRQAVSCAQLGAGGYLAT